MTKMEANKSDPVINVAHTVFNDYVDEYLYLYNTNASPLDLMDIEDRLNSSLLTFLGVLPETDNVSYSGNLSIPTINLSETLSVTIYQEKYYFIRQNPEGQKVDYYTVFSSEDALYKDIKRELDIIYPPSLNCHKQLKIE